MTLKTYNQVSVPSFMYGTAWKKEATARLVQLAVESGFTAIDTANQLIHYQEALVGGGVAVVGAKGVKREGLFLQTKFTSVDGQDHRTPYEASADLTHSSAAVFRQLARTFAYRLSGFLRAPRADFRAEGWGGGLGSVGGDGSVLSSRKNQNDRRQQHHRRTIRRCSASKLR